MKKQFLSLATACLLVAASASAQVEADLTIKHGTVAPTIDGDPSDAVWALIDPVPVEKQFTADPEASVTAFFKMFYTDEYLYLLVDVTDDVHYPVWKNPDDAKNNYLYDKVEVYFDVNDNLKDGGSPAHNGANNPPINPGHAQLAFDFDDEAQYGSGAVIPSDVVYNFLSDQVFVAYNYKAGDQNSYVIEYEFPLEAFINDRDEALNMEAFKALPQGMGFDLTVVDNDNDGQGRKRTVWMSADAEAYQSMDGCGVVVFGDEELPAGSGIGMLDADVVTCYPNPATTTLTVEGDFDTVLLYNLAGQQVKAATGTQVDVADLPTGLYVVKAYQDGACKGVAKVTKD